MRAGRLIALGLSAVLLTIGISSCKPAKSSTIVIFHVNDVHARVHNFAKIAWLLEEERKQNPNVFFMSAGDNFSGNPYVDLYEPKGEPILQLYNRLKLDVQALGNHEFDYGQEVLKRYIERANYPVICANLKVDGAIIPQPKPYTILETKEGVKIAVVSAVQTDRDTGIPSTLPANVKGVTFSDGIESILQYKSLKQENDVLIALTHLGFGRDERLARQMGELDLIIGGHSHTKVDKPVVENGVLIAQAGDHTRYVGRVDLVVKNGKVVEKKSSLIDIKSIKNEIPDVKQMVEDVKKNPALNQEITRLEVSLQGKNELGSLICDSIRDTLDIDIVFQNNGGIRIGKMYETVRLKDAHAMLPFGNDVVVIAMTPEEIRGFIANDFKRGNEPDLQVAGIEYTVLHDKNFAIKDIDIVTTDGKKLDESKTYRVGLNNYIVTAYEFQHQDPGKSSHKKLVDIMIDYLKKGVDAKKYKGIERAKAKLVN